MRFSFALPILLRSSAVLVAAGQRSFSVSDDVLAFPQFEVRFSEDWTSEADADARLRETHDLRVREASTAEDTLQAAASSEVGRYTSGAKQDEQHGASGMGGSNPDFEYEYMVLEGDRWLCAIPRVAGLGNGKASNGSATNSSQTEADQAKELARATSRGWELLSGMQGNCVYFNAGWWSYRFCYNQGVKQFHQLPPGGSVPRYPPVEDPGVTGFMLGAYSKSSDLDSRAGTQEDQPRWEGESALEKSDGGAEKHFPSASGELVQRGETRYLVQRLGGGTRCDLTGKERRIEVQFHCNPQAADRIALIKETSTCAYLMVIQTPRLCNDVAFLPPQKDHPHTVSCSPILGSNQVSEYEEHLEALRAAERSAELFQAQLGENAFELAQDKGAGRQGDGSRGAKDAATDRDFLAQVDEDVLVVGDILVGGRRRIPPGTTLPKSRIVGGTSGQDAQVETLATSDGTVSLTPAELEKHGLGDGATVERLKKELERVAEGKQWKLDMIDTPHGREYRGIIGDDVDGEEAEEYEVHPDGKEAPETKKSGNAGGTQKQKKKKKQASEGSEEEYYHEEL